MTRFFNLRDLKSSETIFVLQVVCFVIGILTSFYSRHAILYILTLLSCTGLYIGAFNIYNKKIIRILLFILFGLFIGYIKVKSLHNPIPKRMTDEKLTGTVNFIKQSSEYTFVTINKLSFHSSYLSQYNNKGLVRLKFTPDSALNIMIGDVVTVKANLNPIRQTLFPGDESYYDYARFANIIATGNKVELLENIPFNKVSISSIMDKFRRDVQNDILRVANRSAGSGLVIAILTGNTNFIPKDNLESMRRAGCAHILAISGLHMSIVAVFIFIITTRLFVLFPSIALKYNTLKISYLIACIGCFFYLQIATISVSALRSFLIIAFSCLAILVDRVKMPMRTLFLTLLVILIFNPEYILTPSLQMSFMAVLSLISVYRYKNNEQIDLPVKNIIIKYTFNVMLSSIAATFSTVFFEIYHFKQYAWIGIFSNLLAIPLTEFITLPLSFIGLILHNTYIGGLSYQLAAFISEYIFFITDFFSHIDGAFILVHLMPKACIAIITIGLLILFVLQSRIRYFGLILIAFGMFVYVTDSKPDLVIGGNKSSNLVFKVNNDYYQYTDIKDKFLQSSWMNNLGVQEFKSINTLANKDSIILCDDTQCVFNKHNKSILISFKTLPYDSNIGIFDAHIDGRTLKNNVCSVYFGFRRIRTECVN